MPWRSTSVFAAIATCSGPFPEPVLPEGNVIQGTLLEAVQAQPFGAVTETGTLPPLPGTFWLAGEIEYVHPPSCVTVNVWPPAVMAALRCAPVFGAAEKRTVPLPLPAAPAVTVSQVGSPLVAFQPHPSAVRTSNAPLPPPAGTDAEAAESEKAQPCPWLTVNVRPAIVIVPERDGPLVPSTVKLTVPLPLPPGGFDVIRIQSTLLLACQLQPPPAVTETVPLPPDDGTFCESGEIENVHPCP
jgi:hypothetical protein